MNQTLNIYAVYDSYDVAKAMNPECDIFTNSEGKFRAIIEPVTSHFDNGWRLVKPIPQTKEELIDGVRASLAGFADIENNCVMFHSDMSTVSFYEVAKSFVSEWDEAIGCKNEEKETDTIKQLEWESGDIAVYQNTTVLVIGYHPHQPSVIVDCEDGGLFSVGIDRLSKPETPEAKKEREELEAAYQLQSRCAIAGSMSFETFKKYDCAVNFWKAIVKETGYRVER